MLVGSQASGSSRLDPERAQHLDGVRPELQSGADLAELAGAFVDVDLEAALAQRAGGREPADARLDHRDASAAWSRSRSGLAQYPNCSRRMRSSRLWPGSNSICIEML